MGELSEPILRVLLASFENGEAVFEEAARATRDLLFSKPGPYTETDCAALLKSLESGVEVLKRMDKATEGL